MKNPIKTLWNRLLNLFSKPKLIPKAINRQERRTRMSIARKQAAWRAKRETSDQSK